MQMGRAGSCCLASPANFTNQAAGRHNFAGSWSGGWLQVCVKGVEPAPGLVKKAMGKDYRFA